MNIIIMGTNSTVAALLSEAVGNHAFRFRSLEHPRFTEVLFFLSSDYQTNNDELIWFVSL